MSFRFRSEDREVSVKNVVLTIIFWALTLACILLIFLLSSIPVNEVASLTEMFSSSINGSKSINIYSSDHALLSTIGHVFEFSILTFFSYMAISSTNKISVKTSYAESPMKILKSDNEMNIIFTLWFTILNAIFDEYHQLFAETGVGIELEGILCGDDARIVVVTAEDTVTCVVA